MCPIHSACDVSIKFTIKGQKINSWDLNEAEISPCLEETFGFLRADKLAFQTGDAGRFQKRFMTSKQLQMIFQ